MNFSPDFAAARQFKSVLLILAAAALVFLAPTAMAQDDDYLAIYGVIEQADSLAANGKNVQAHAKYLEAQRELTTFKQSNPGWNDQMVAYRISYVGDKLKATSGEAVSTTADDSSTTAGKSKMAGATGSPVKLLDAGSEPRTVLRLHPVVGDKQTVTLTFNGGAEVSMAGNAMPAQDSPEVSVTLDSVVTDVATNGDCTYQLTLTDANLGASKSLPPDAAKQFQTQFDTIKGTTATARTSNHAINQSLVINLPPDKADPKMAEGVNEAFAFISTALPEEAVGAGAKWDYHFKSKVKDMKFDGTIHYELKSVDGDQVKLSTVFNQNLSNQKIQNPMMPGMTMDMSKLIIGGNCSVDLNLGKALPAAVNLGVNMQMSMNMGTPQQKQTMDIKAKLQVEIMSK